MTPIDHYFKHNPSAWERLQTASALHFALRGCQLDPNRPQLWTPTIHPHLNHLMTLEPGEDSDQEPLRGDRDVIISTVRMGYGHHRIALAICSQAEPLGRRGLLLDLLASPRDEALAIRRMDSLYSFMSRISSDMGGPIEAFWGKLMQSGGVGAARLAFLMASHLDALLAHIPRDVPFISAYPLNGHLAVKLGFKRVINLIFDNDPQPFLIVPGALNLVQTTSSLERLRLLGVPRKEVALGGHWVARDLLTNLETDAATRIARATQGAPRRLLVAIGGAGAQRKFVFAYLEALKPLLQTGTIRVMLNLGDHKHLRAPCGQLLASMGVKNVQAHGPAKLDTFMAEHPLQGDTFDEGLEPLTVFSFDEHFDAVLATDRLMRITDILVTKPSELAFVPVPKLHIRRVGDHEAASARRSAELGDGTLECREIPEAIRMTRLLAEGDEFIRPMNESIVNNGRRGVYDGARIAIEQAIADGVK